MSPGVLFSSGYIAGGAIAGIAVALLSLSPSLAGSLDLSASFPFAQSDAASVLAFGALALALLLVGAEKVLKDKRAR